MTKLERRQAWMRQFETALLLLVPTYSGRIEWDSATHFYFEGYSPAQAADRYLSVR